MYNPKLVELAVKVAKNKRLFEYAKWLESTTEDDIQETFYHACMHGTYLVLDYLGFDPFQLQKEFFKEQNLKLAAYEKFNFEEWLNNFINADDFYYPSISNLSEHYKIRAIELDFKVYIYPQVHQEILELGVLLDG